MTKPSGAHTHPGQGAAVLAVAAAVLVVLALEWIVSHIWWIFATTVAIGAAGTALYFLALRYQDRRAAIVAAGFAELREQRRAQLTRQPDRQLSTGVQLILTGPEAVELAARLFAPPAIPGPAGDAITQRKPS
jgi:hypothetical protein